MEPRKVSVGTLAIFTETDLVGIANEDEISIFSHFYEKTWSWPNPTPRDLAGHCLGSKCQCRCHRTSLNNERLQ